MFKAEILSKAKIREYDNPPVLNHKQQCKLFRLPEGFKTNTQINRIGLTLLYGYFRATGRFFTPSKFREKDISFVCISENILPIGINIQEYKLNTVRTHKDLILNHLGFDAYSKDKHDSLVKKHVSLLLESQIDTVSIFTEILKILCNKKVELPTYNHIHILISNQFKLFQSKIEDTIQKHITTDQCVKLNALLDRYTGDKPNRSTYILGILKNISVNPKHSEIQSNIKKIEQLKKVQKCIVPVLNKLPLTQDGVRYIGDLVISYQTAQIRKKSLYDRYLHLMCFVDYQTRMLTDQLIRAYLDKVKSALESVKKDHDKNRLKAHQKSKPKVARVIRSYNDMCQINDSATSILWKDDDILSAEEKIAQLQRLFPEQKKPDPVKEDIHQIDKLFNFNDKKEYQDLLKKVSKTLQRNVSGIVKALEFNPKSSNPDIITAIGYFKKVDGNIKSDCPCHFLSEEQLESVFPKSGFEISLWKIYLFTSIMDAIKSGDLNLNLSYQYKAYDDYLIDSKTWESNKETLIKESGLEPFQNPKLVLDQLKPVLHERFTTTNRNIKNGNNTQIKIKESGKFTIKTPKVHEDVKGVQELFPNDKVLSIISIMSSIEQKVGYLNGFSSKVRKYQKNSPENKLFYAAIMAYGCNIGIPKMGKIASQIQSNRLETTANNYLTLENLEAINRRVISFTNNLELPQLYRRAKGKLQTSSDGQKFSVDGDTIFASYSPKYFGADKGVTVYSYTDERNLLFSSTVFNSNEYEASYVLDGLLNNPIIKTSTHSTDTHGSTEVVFGLMDLFGFEFTPRIKKIFEKTLYSFERKRVYEDQDYKVLPSAYIDERLICNYWDDILRLACSIKLKHCTASQIFKRLNSYSRQHPVYKALKEYGRIMRTVHILKMIDDVELRQNMTKQLNKIERSNQFSKAVCFSNSGKLIFLHQNEQLISQAATRLIKNIIICWNYLYLEERLRKTKTENERKYLMELILSGSAMSWKHIHFSGHYDFSEANMEDLYLIQSA